MLKKTCVGPESKPDFNSESEISELQWAQFRESTHTVVRGYDSISYPAGKYFLLQVQLN